MLYLLLISHDRSRRDELDEQARQDLARRYIAFRDQLKERGALRDAERLSRPETVFHVRLTNGETQILEGPAAPAEEAPTGLLLVECADEAEALELAAQVPGAEIGSVEIRPVWPLSQDLA